jgi:hypothetical protein
MKARLTTRLFALTLTTFAAAAAQADEANATLAWQQPGYVMDVVIATAPRLPAASTTTDLAATTNPAAMLAWQEPGYVEEVVVVSANRREVLAAAAENWLNRPIEARRIAWMGMPAR